MKQGNRLSAVLAGIALMVAVGCSGGPETEPVLVHSIGEKAPVVALAADGNSGVFALTTDGTLFRIAQSGATETVAAGLKKCGFSHSTLAVLPDGRVLTNGCREYKDLLVAIDRDGKVKDFVKLDHSLSSLVVNQSGKVYLGYWISEGNLTVSRFLQRADNLTGVIAELAADGTLTPVYTGGIPQGLARGPDGTLYAAVWGEAGPFTPKPGNYSMCGPTRNFWVAMAQHAAIIHLDGSGNVHDVSGGLAGCAHVAVLPGGRILGFGNVGGGECGLHVWTPGETAVRKVFKDDESVKSLTCMTVSGDWLYFADLKHGVYRVALAAFKKVSAPGDKG